MRQSPDRIGAGRIDPVRLNDSLFAPYGGVGLAFRNRGSPACLARWPPRPHFSTSICRSRGGPIVSPFTLSITSIGVLVACLGVDISPRLMFDEALRILEIIERWFA